MRAGSIANLEKALKPMRETKIIKTVHQVMGEFMEVRSLEKEIERLKEKIRGLENITSQALELINGRKYETCQNCDCEILWRSCSQKLVKDSGVIVKYEDLQRCTELSKR